MRILIIEDEVKTAKFLKKGLGESGFVVDIAKDGLNGLHLALEVEFDGVILDLMLPEMDGWQVLSRLRQANRHAPVLLLTALDAVHERVRGFDLGADDYLVKPFAFSELVARVAALGRRPRQTAPVTSLRVDDLEMDLLARVVRRGGQPIDLQPREFRLLEYLMQHADQVVTRAMLLEKVWDLSFDPHTNVVETHVSRLRAKVDKGHSTSLIHTIRGSGYCLRAAP
jgi:two-component system OmpR family response regulator